jgi:hypothetical protein
MPETKENKFGAAFHAHLDACAQCREHPFDLCPTGSLLLRSSATEEVVRGGYLCGNLPHGCDQDPMAHEWSGKVAKPKKT